MNIEQLEQFLLDAAAQARKDAAEGKAPDVNSILNSQASIKELDPKAVQNTIVSLRQIAATKEGARRIVAIISLAVKYGANLM